MKCAQLAGAEVYQHTPVVGLEQRPDGTWDVRVESGDVIHAEHVVNAGGLWAREVGRMVGIELPVLAMEHHYLLTEDMPEVAAHVAKTGHEMPMALDFAGEIYIRQEGGAMLLGTYEQACVPWSPTRDAVGLRVAAAQARPRPDHARAVSVAFKHYPAMGTTGIQRVVNGPFTFSPDGNPLVGPVRGLRGFWVACGVMAGLSQGGGVGLALATWMTAGDHGDSGMDIWAMDVARYGDYATLAYTNAKVQENYRRRFRITFPNEELPAARPLLTTPIYDRLTDANAVWGATFGLEHALWFQEPGLEPRRGGDVPALERLGRGRRGGRRRPRAGRDDRDLELREVPGQRAGRRGVAVVAADGPDAGAGPDHADGDAQRGRAGSSASSRSPAPSEADEYLPLRLAAGGGPPLALVPRTTCRPTARSASRCSGSAWSGCPWPGRGRATCSRRSPPTSTSRPRRSRS